ncbi:MAG: selenide, water dikinase SelD [Fuerstiella sp.]|nr:selenide, water dikinase SelD [Fuerstiella sp.]
MKAEHACRRHVVLMGVGHTNAHIVRMWAMDPLPDTDLTCISDSGTATYSGFLPAVLAGQLPSKAMEIDLIRLCAAAGARLITDRVTGLDRLRKQLLFAERPPVPYDVLSVGIGSVPQMPTAGADSPSFVTIKPMRSFLDRLEAAVSRCSPQSRLLQVVVVGGGVAGAEVTQCLSARIRLLTESEFHITLVDRGNELLPGCIPKTTRRVLNTIQKCGHTVLHNNAVEQVDESGVRLQTGKTLPADIVIWATAAAAPTLLSKFDLPKDNCGFLLTHSTLRCTSGDPIFAVGDTGTMEHGAVPKAGVYAVRQGPVLWNNIQRQLDGRELLPYVPQKSFLKLLNMGDGTAVGEWRGVSFAGRWVMRLKQWIDQRFMDQYQQLPNQMNMPDEMQCRGCGCKLGGDALNAALGATVDGSREDATVIRIGSNDATNESVLVTTDFFSAPFPDAWLTGRIAAIHAASDIYATGAKPFAAEAIVVLPEGDEATQQNVLSNFQQGAEREFCRMGATITGGHTITGPRWEVGFTVFGRPLGNHLIRKQGMCPGDQLVLTKPLGSGVLMAAQMRAKCRHSDFESMIEIMLLGNHDAARIAVDVGVVAGTDITGFGLLGHLHEMLTDDVRITLNGNRIPVMPGSIEAARQGIASSLLPSNRCYLRDVVVSGNIDLPLRAPSHAASHFPGERDDAGEQVQEYGTGQNESVDLLLDPQTCGGLLLSVPSECVSEFQRRFAESELPEPALIGTVSLAESSAPRIAVDF